MSAVSIVKARWMISNLSKKDMEEKVQKVINLAAAEEVSKELDKNTDMSYISL